MARLRKTPSSAEFPSHQASLFCSFLVTLPSSPGYSYPLRDIHEARDTSQRSIRKQDAPTARRSASFHTRVLPVRTARPTFPCPHPPSPAGASATCGGATSANTSALPPAPAPVAVGSAAGRRAHCAPSRPGPAFGRTPQAPGNTLRRCVLSRAGGNVAVGYSERLL